MPSSCAAFAPALLCAHGDIALYLLPSAALAFLIFILSRLHPLFFLLTLAGTICHELAHLVVGQLVGARPVSLSIIPRRIALPGKRWQWRLGSVTLSRVTWYNAAPSALAPLLIVLLPLGVAWWRTRGDWHFAPLDLALALALAPQWLSFWPSAADWRIAARSWPCLLIIAGIAVAISLWHDRLFQLVKI